MKPLFLLCSISILGLAACAEQPATTNAVRNFNNTVCPVMGGKVSGKNHVVYNNIQYELCCNGCEVSFLKEPAKYLAKLPNTGKIVEGTNTNCPVMGGAVNTNIFTVYNGTKIYFCCPGCDKPFAADPVKYMKKLTPDDSPIADGQKQKNDKPLTD